ncbi:3-phenylpropionate/cinnamic acid dioxygenase, small subunit [Azospirillum oryzae]|uniref:3-phenylpropionate/cinnamic acid dioxygenase, small subunit n=1 Tax=Azospirillum oryzae TaxID=286727 RepID=A0A1X7HNN0_9PROT|nr:aromatic-ring-hydroxylating dioxygenase subunit beta [Azospirillum oryzae]SMF89864.1 3-phenylpropionate/cinnamic acid dioxygenase, small subunit [Azospirillum oryzae]
MNTQLLTEVSAFLWQEADMLDHRDYQDWLAQWTADGLYIVPIDPDVASGPADLADRLNYAYDDADMRAKRVARLTSGESVSTQPASRTVRSLSRFRILADDGATVTVRAAQHLREFRKETLRDYTADVTYELVRGADGFRLRGKIVRLVNSTDALHSIGYIL